MSILFTMHADAQNFVGSGDIEGMAGLEIHFDLNIADGAWMRVSGGPRMTLLQTERVTGYVRSDGRMYDTAAVSPIPYDIADPGALGVRLLANDPALNLVNDVSYHVSGSAVVHGRPWAFLSFNTPAVPSTDTAVDLASFAPGPGETVVGVPALGLVDQLADMSVVGKAVARGDAAAGRAALGVDLAGLSEWEWYANLGTGAGSFPWPQGLVGLWDFQHDIAGGRTVTSRVGARPVALTAFGSKTVVKDAADPGPFGPSLVLDGATAFVKVDNIGGLDVSQTGDQVTVIDWVKDTSNLHTYGGPNGIAYRAGSHTEGEFPARQYASYFDANGYLNFRAGHFTPHIGAQDGPSPGYPFNRDYGASHRMLFTGTGQGQWHMEAFTYDGEKVIAYIDGIADVFPNVLEGNPIYLGGGLRQTVDRNPFILKKGINRSQTTKAFSIGGSATPAGSPVVYTGSNFTTGKLGGVAVFNRALSAAEIMQIRLATLLPGEPVTMYSFEEDSTGVHSLDDIGWSARARSFNVDVSLASGSDYCVSRPVAGTKAFLQKASTVIGAAWGPVTGLNSSQIRRLRFKMLSSATTSAAQRLLVKVGSQWWASNTTYATSGAHASDTDWSGAETKTHAVSWDIGQWKAVTISDTGGTATWQNLAKNPALNVNATNWFKSSSAANATAARVSDGAGGFVYRLTWTGTDAGTVPLGGLGFLGVDAVTAGNVYSASMLVTPSKAATINLQLQWVNASNAVLSVSDGGNVSVAANTATTLAVTATAPAGATQVTVRAQSSGGSWVSSDTLDLTKALPVAGDYLPAYFDGTTSGAVWDGTAGNSTSTETIATGVLSLSGSTNAAYIDNSLITAVGFLSSGGDGTAVRVTDLELLPT